MTQIQVCQRGMFDSHAHTDAFAVDEWRLVAQRAWAYGVRGNLSAGVWWSDLPRLVSDYSDWVVAKSSARQGFSTLFESARSYFVLPSLGLHPMEIAQRWRAADGRFNRGAAEADAGFFYETAEKYKDLLWAVGETGFDASAQVRLGWSDKAELLAAQKFAFGVCAETAAARGLPLVIHSRSAWQQTMTAIKEARAQGVHKFMIHCYGGPAEDLPWISCNGGFASFGGVATWPDAHKVHQSLSSCPSGALLFETDSPDLSPVLSDGTRLAINEPRFLCDVVSRAAVLRGVPHEEVQHLAKENFTRFIS